MPWNGDQAQISKIMIFGIRLRLFDSTFYLDSMVDRNDLNVSNIRNKGMTNHNLENLQIFVPTKKP